MTTGHLDEEPATQRATQALLDAHPDLVAFLAQEPTISREFQDPYLGGISKDGNTVYIASDLPIPLPKTGIDPTRYLALHEKSEWWLMTRLGMDYLGEDGSDGAHHVAVRIEHNALMGDGHDSDEYEDELAGYIETDEHEGVTPDTVPPDLFLEPYEDDETSLDKELLPILKAAAVRLTGQKLDHNTVSYSKGHDPEFCRTCEYFDGQCRFVQNVAPDGWCVLWQKG